MRKFHTLFVAAAALSTLVSSGAAQTKDSLMAFYSQKLSSHRHFSAPFTQTRRLEMFKKPIVSTGRLSFSYPDRIKFHYKTPFESIVLFNEGDMRRYRVENGAYVEQPTLEVVAKAITKEILRYLSGGFTADFPYDISVDDQDNRHITLTPKIAAARAIFATIELRFPENPTYVKSVKLNESSGDYILIEHDKPSFAPVPDSVFTVPK